jgi:hypothetical protein
LHPTTVNLDDTAEGWIFASRVRLANPFDKGEAEEPEDRDPE